MPRRNIEGFLRMNRRLDALRVVLVESINNHLPRFLTLFLGLAFEVEGIILPTDLALKIGWFGCCQAKNLHISPSESDGSFDLPGLFFGCGEEGN
ncbi:hypothetical protein [Alloacidobacterium sp.]|uniref:hypothetical protein n=1 Tax=Alloacidobacterium sp. TaxID=2951999 RepID=UPI002D264086|nr:hypothetical protein [Alloacidobacterium sp.]HYK35846.1 hypothetical protein [Alloacidobacterium sp.]